MTSEAGVQQYALNSGSTSYGSTISLLKEYGLQGYTYNSITERKASELHEVGKDGKILDDFQDSEKSDDKLWLLSKTEANTYFADDTVRTAKTFRNTITNYTYWWLRSPSNKFNNFAYVVDDLGDVDDSESATFDAFGIRPAFTLEIQ